MKFCPECGQKNTTDSLFCSNCGTSLQFEKNSTEPSDNVTTNQPSYTSKTQNPNPAYTSPANQSNQRYQDTGYQYNQNPKRPTRLTVIIVLQWIFAAIFVISGLFLSLSQSYRGSDFHDFVVVGYVLIGIGIFGMVLAYGLGKYNNAARYIVGGLSALNFVTSIISLFIGASSGILSIVYAGFVAHTLLFHDETKVLFQKDWN